METAVFVIVALSILLFGFLSRRAEQSILTPPIFFVLVGLCVAGLGGGEHLEISEHMVHTLAEITLVMVLFTDASRIRLGMLRKFHDLPIRLLMIGMPLTVVLGTAAAVGLFPNFTLWEAALLAAILAPTDAALGQAVVSSPKVPVRIRQSLNVESGLNDGIALPLVLVFLSTCASAIPGLGGTEYWLRFAALQVTLGPLVGILVGYLGAKLICGATAREWMNETFQHLSTLGLALLAFAGAELVHGNGFIAAFVAGLTLGNTADDSMGEGLYEFAEAEGQLLTLLVFLAFGASMVPELSHYGWTPWLYGALSLTVIRMLPVALSLIGSGVQKETVLFLGWFGPRGIASILFGLVVLSSSELVSRSEIFATVIATVFLSVFAHGVTAFPGTGWYARRLAAAGSDSLMEQETVPEMRVRIRHGE